MIAHGTAVAALDASSLMCTHESKEPIGADEEIDKHQGRGYLQIVHTGERKLRMKAKPFVQPLTVEDVSVADLRRSEMSQTILETTERERCAIPQLLGRRCRKCYDYGET